jgi:intracellular septation protein
VSDIFVATAVAIGATVVQIGWVLARRQKVSNMQWMSLVIIVIFGGATLLLRDETFIKWKPSVLYWLAGIVFLGGLAFGTNLVKAVMGEGLTLPEPGVDPPRGRVGRVLPLQGNAQPLGRVQLLAPRPG